MLMFRYFRVWRSSSFWEIWEEVIWAGNERLKMDLLDEGEDEGLWRRDRVCRQCGFGEEDGWVSRSFGDYSVVSDFTGLMCQVAEKYKCGNI